MEYGADREIPMMRLRIATSEGFQEITPKTLSRCGFTNGCQLASYVDGPADSDPYYHCDLYDQRTDGKRLYQCINATNPVVVESLRDKAEQYAERYEGYSRTIEVSFPHGRWPLVYHTLCFVRTPCICDEHGAFYAALLPGEKPRCPRCVEAWENAMREVLYKICTRALAHLHRECIRAEGRKFSAESALQQLALRPNSDWSALGENPPWNRNVTEERHWPVTVTKA